jgi:hypothetical protein
VVVPNGKKVFVRHSQPLVAQLEERKAVKEVDHLEAISSILIQGIAVFLRCAIMLTSWIMDACDCHTAVLSPVHRDHSVSDLSDMRACTSADGEFPYEG